MQGNLKKHINSEQVKNMFQCEKCDETFGSRGNFIDGKCSCQPQNNGIFMSDSEYQHVHNGN